MPLMPRRVKFRKSQRGIVKGNAQRGNTVSYGEFGLQELPQNFARFAEGRLIKPVLALEPR